jgi:hypothetical protein
VVAEFPKMKTKFVDQGIPVVHSPSTWLQEHTGIYIHATKPFLSFAIQAIDTQDKEDYLFTLTLL